ncbi:TIR domain-containing protein [Paenibacillus marchantiae]|uniref:TIR domain-containing protein n=1 Tax=Paenibacillus marchantiae TaxID=3026433 RepID=UPI00237A82DF|nr:TIR domain-containing protein [Paenibacillus marchantiae]WDQ30471.1 TIR domain-containing protein [Paenibacillus marchantiae]
MARKTFISYKYSEAWQTRDKIISALGVDARYYQGETSSSPNLMDRKTETIKHHLKNMIFDSSVTIVVISPNMKQSNWIDWEIEYSLKEVTRGDKTSRVNGIVGVIQKDYYFGGYGWLLNSITNSDGCSSRNIDNSKLYDIIIKNRTNLKRPVYVCPTCQSVSSLDGSYISLVTEDEFISNPNMYIENAFEKSKRINDFEITKTIKTQKNWWSAW